MCLESVLPHIISPDQTGFIKDRFSFFDISRLFNVIYHPSQSSTPEIVVSLYGYKINLSKRELSPENAAAINLTFDYFPLGVTSNTVELQYPTASQAFSRRTLKRSSS